MKMLKKVDTELNALIATIPNQPNASVPIGKDESENKVIRTIGEKKAFDFTPIPHWDLGPALGIIDFEQGVKITGSRFYVLNGAGARLTLPDRMDAGPARAPGIQGKIHAVHGQRRNPVASASPKFAENLYRDHEEDLWMVPTAEVPLTGIHMGDVIDSADLPLRYTAYTPCFRREKTTQGATCAASSAGTSLKR